MKKIKVHKGTLLGRYFKTLEQAVEYYNNKLPEPMRKMQSVIQFPNGECLICGNEQIKAISK